MDKYRNKVGLIEVHKAVSSVDLPPTRNLNPCTRISQQWNI